MLQVYREHQAFSNITLGRPPTNGTRMGGQSDKKKMVNPSYEFKQRSGWKIEELAQLHAT